MGDGGGAGVSLTPAEREARLEALKAALTSWPRVEFVRIERRWRGLKAADVEAGIVDMMWWLVGVCDVEVVLRKKVLL
jgi:hypothetical protein